MFTGLIEQLGTLHARTPTPAGQRLLIAAPEWSHKPSLGESIAINGCCLTLAADVSTTNNLLAFDAIPETLAKTTLGELQPGDRVHIEPSATLATLLGGHLVQGHIDGVGIVQSVTTQGEWRARTHVPQHLMPFFAPKGSIAVQGVSLTIMALDPRECWFEIALIPTTLAKTTLGSLQPGSRVNLECDPIAKQIVHYLQHFGR
jgi:riboflavin synthase